MDLINAKLNWENYNAVWASCWIYLLNYHDLLFIFQLYIVWQNICYYRQTNFGKFRNFRCVLCIYVRMIFFVCVLLWTNFNTNITFDHLLGVANVHLILKELSLEYTMISRGWFLNEAWIFSFSKNIYVPCKTTAHNGMKNCLKCMKKKLSTEEY